MSHRRKHVSQALSERCPELGEGQCILRVCGPRGSNLLEARRLQLPPRAARAHSQQVENTVGESMLVRMPNKFNKLLWVKRGTAAAGRRRRRLLGDC